MLVCNINITTNIDILTLRSDIMGVKSFIRVKTFYCGGSQNKKAEYIEQDLFPMFDTNPSKHRHKRKNINPAELDPREQDKYVKQQNLNDNRTKRYCQLLAMTNFKVGDYFFSPTYSDEYLPKDYDEAKQKANNFLRRLKRMAKKKGCELKYIGVTEIGSVHGRFHHHFIVNKDCGLTREEIEDAWGYGHCNTKINQDTVECIGYLLKAGRAYKGQRMYMASRNLKKPTVTSSDSKVSKAKFLQLKLWPTDCEAMKKFFERMNPDYEVIHIYRHMPTETPADEETYREQFAYFRIKMRLRRK